MRRAWFLAAAVVACAGAPTPPAAPPLPPAAPTEPTVAAEPPEPEPLTKGDVTVAWWKGMEILVKRLPGADLVAEHLYVKGGARNWGKDDAGVEQLALAVASSGGTTELDKDAFSRRLAHLGSTISSSTGNEYSVLASKSLKAEWSATFALLAEVFLRPALPPAEIELRREQQLSGLKHEAEDPDGSLRVLLHHALWKGHPIDNRAVGTLETVAALERSKLAAHLEKLRETSRLLLVVAGDVEPKAVLEQAKTLFAATPRGSYRDEPFPKITLTEPNLVVAERKLPTNYIQSICFGPSWTDPDFPAAIIASEILRTREFEEVRTKRNLSYAPGAYFSWATSLPRGGLYVTAVDPNTTFKVMLAEVTKLRDEPVPEKDLVGNRSVYLTNYLAGKEGTDGQAALLAEAELFGGSWELAQSLPDKLRAVTAADVQRYAKKYFAHLLTAVLGDPTRVDPALFKSL